MSDEPDARGIVVRPSGREREVVEHRGAHRRDEVTCGGPGARCDGGADRRSVGGAQHERRVACHCCIANVHVSMWNSGYGITQRCWFELVNRDASRSDAHLAGQHYALRLAGAAAGEEDDVRMRLGEPFRAPRSFAGRSAISAASDAAPARRAPVTVSAMNQGMPSSAAINGRAGGRRR